MTVLFLKAVNSFAILTEIQYERYEDLVKYINFGQVC